MEAELKGPKCRDDEEEDKVWANIVHALAKVGRHDCDVVEAGSPQMALGTDVERDTVL